MRVEGRFVTWIDDDGIGQSIEARSELEADWIAQRLSKRPGVFRSYREAFVWPAFALMAVLWAWAMLYSFGQVRERALELEAAQESVLESIITTGTEVSP